MPLFNQSEGDYGLQDLRNHEDGSQEHIVRVDGGFGLDSGGNRNRSNMERYVMSKKQTNEMTHSQLVNENKPKPLFYKGTEGKKMARPCMMCGVVVMGTLGNLERHVNANHPKVWNGYDYTNQAWIVDGVYIKCFCPEPGTICDPGRPGGPGGPKFVATLCRCYGRLHEGEPPMIGASIH